MPKAVIDSIKRRAASIVLARMGKEMAQVMQSHLQRSYGISLTEGDPSIFSFDQLHFGLSVLLGEGNANILLQQITKEIVGLSEQAN